MQTVKFGNKEYELVGVSKTAAKLSITIKKNADTVDAIANAADGNNAVDIYSDGELTTRYSGFSKLFVIYLIKGGEFDTVSIELDNTDLAAQIDALAGDVSAVQSTVNSQNASINNLSSSVNNLTESQEIQDLAIEDLAEALSDVAPEE